MISFKNADMNYRKKGGILQLRNMKSSLLFLLFTNQVKIADIVHAAGRK